MACNSIRSFAGMVLREVPRLIIVRQRLEDGYSDDVLRIIAEFQVRLRTRVIVLLPANAAPASLVRQIELGADCVQRDPVRSDVLLAYVGRYLREVNGGGASEPGNQPRTTKFADATWRADERSLTLRSKKIVLTSREAMLVELLVRSKGEVVSYETLYSEIIGRSFDGDTSNMRVLLGRLGASLGAVGCSLRDWIEVLPKNGYRYGAALGLAASRRKGKKSAKNRNLRYG